MAEGEAILPVTGLGGLFRALYDHDESGEAVISQWGLLTWGQIRDELLGEGLLAFPRLRYEPSFIRDVQRGNMAERVRLQRVLARVAAILIENEGNPNRLKSHGGIQYDNYTGKSLDGRPVGHFRISDGVRVSCLAEDGSLTLRHFGPHDVVNSNP